jgi:hypothetical protein
MTIRGTTKMKGAAVAAACAAGGAIAGITGAAASPSTHSSTSKSKAPAVGRFWGHFGPRAGAIGFGPAVHETAVVLNKAGTGFITATVDSGTVQSVSGDQLTIKEGVGKVTYKTVTLTIPSGASVYRNFASSSLSALRSGDHVRVAQSSEGTNVIAIADSYVPPFHRPGQFRRGWAGPAGVPGPPPAAPPAAGA